MTALFKADMRRILKKRSFTVTLIVLFFINLFQTIGASDLPVDEFIGKTQGYFDGLMMLWITIVIYLGVFADDSAANTIAVLLGRGMKREQVFLIRLIDSAAAAAVMFSVSMLFRQFFIALFNVRLSARQKTLLWIYVLFLIIRASGCLAAALLVQYITGSTALAVFTDVAASVLVQLVLQVIRTLYGINLYHYSLSGLVDAAYANLAVGRAPWQLIPAAFFYVFALIWLAAFINARKEMDL